MRKKDIANLATKHPITESNRAEVVNLAIAQLDKFQRVATEIKKYKPVRIRYRGKWLILPSGKTIWKRIGDAKSALRNSMQSTCEFDRYPDGVRGYRLRGSKEFIGDYGRKEVCDAYCFQAMLDAVEFINVDPVDKS